MKELVQSHLQLAQPIQRLSVPIQVDAAILYDALKQYEEEKASRVTIVLSDTMDRLKSLCDELKATKKNDADSQYLSFNELFKLAKILFVEPARWWDKLTLKVVDCLKKKTGLNQIEALYVYLEKQQPSIFDITVFSILCLFPRYAEKNIGYFHKYPVIVHLLRQSYKLGLLTEDVYMDVITNPKYAEKAKEVGAMIELLDDIQKSSVCVDQKIYSLAFANLNDVYNLAVVFHCIRKIPMLNNEKIYLAVLKNARVAYASWGIFSRLRLIPELDNQETYLAIFANIEYVQYIQEVFNKLDDGRPCEHNQKAYLAVWKNAQYAKEIKSVLSCFGHPLWKNNKEINLPICLVICEDIQRTYSNLKDLRPYSENILLAFSTLSELGIYNEVTCRIIINHPNEAIHLAEKIREHVQKMSTYFSINLLDALDCDVSDWAWYYNDEKRKDILNEKTDRVIEDFSEFKKTSLPSKNFHIYAFRWADRSREKVLSIVAVVGKLQKMNLPESVIERIFYLKTALMLHYQL